MNRLFKKMTAVVAAFLFFFIVTAPKAEAGPMREIMVTSAYGACAGTLVGLATLAFDNNARNIAMGASIGLYAGIALGIYLAYGVSSAPEAPKPEDMEPLDLNSGLHNSDKMINTSLLSINRTDSLQVGFPAFSIGFDRAPDGKNGFLMSAPVVAWTF